MTFIHLQKELLRISVGLVILSSFQREAWELEKHSEKKNVLEKFSEKICMSERQMLNTQ